MILCTNDNNPNALKLIIGAKLARISLTVKIVSPHGKSCNLYIQVSSYFTFKIRGYDHTVN